MSEMQALQSDHRLERGRRLKLAIISSILVRPIAVLIPVLVIPIFIRYLGVEGYGVFEAVSSLAVWISLTNIGLGFGLNNRLMDCHVSGDRELARSYVSTLFFSMLPVLAIGALVIAGLSFAVDWRSLLHVTGAVTDWELRLAVLLSLVIPLVGVTLNYAPSIYSAYQEIHRQNAWDAIAKIMTVAACICIPYTAWGIPGAVFAISGISVAVGLGNLCWLWSRAKPWLRPTTRLFRIELLWKLLHDGFLLFLLQSFVALIFQADRLVIGMIRTPAEVAQYGVLSRCFMLAYGAFFLVLGPLWPAYGEAFRRGDVAWCKSKLRLTVLIGLGIMSVTGATLMLAGNHILAMLVHDPGFRVPLAAIAGMSVACILRTWADSHSVLLNGANVLRPQVVLLGANAIVAVAISIFATRWFGIVGTAWSYPIAAILTTVWGYPVLVRRHMRSASADRHDSC